MAGYDGGLAAMPMMPMQSLTAVALPVLSPPVFLAPIAAPTGIDIATEVQRMIETESFKPLSLSEVTARLSSASQRGLDASRMTVEQVGAVEHCATCGSLSFEDLRSQQLLQDDGLMVSVPRSPWLGTNAKPPEEHGVPTGKPQILGLIPGPCPPQRPG
eukprot:Skav222277  [mRNA]  locus=scaffold807:97493:101600:- [translate_table: standard]